MLISVYYQITRKKANVFKGDTMKLVKLEKIHEGKFLSYYVAEYLTAQNHIKKYEFTSRKKDLTVETLGNSVPAGVGMVPFHVDNNRILLQKEYRLACNRWVFNFPAGLIDEGETIEETARRELKEETGAELVEIVEVLSPSYASPATSDELMVIVVCKCQGEIKDSTFEEEEIHAKWYTKEEVKKLLDDGEYMSVRTQMFLWQWINN